MGCRQCLPLSVVQLKSKHCQKPCCRNVVIDTFGQGGIHELLGHNFAPFFTPPPAWTVFIPEGEWKQKACFTMFLSEWEFVLSMFNQEKTWFYTSGSSKCLINYVVGWFTCETLGSYRQTKDLCWWDEKACSEVGNASLIRAHSSSIWLPQ